ncbi:MAG: SprB repeat-containing protein [Bacteroidetes bacterium]|nr:SprB repeat-containing protein [Bacteroidota bacterium]
MTFGTLNNTSDCSTTGGGASVLNMYSDYTALPAPTVISGQSVPFSVTVGYCSGTAYGMVFAIYIDWNRDGDFADVGETTYTSAPATAAVTGTAYPGSITVPSFASAGNTRMRVVMVEGGPAPATGTYTWGETEDYTINVLSGTGLTYAWTPVTNLSNPNISNPIANPSTSTTYTVTVSDPGGCTAFTTVPVTVVAPPAAPTVVNDSRCGQGIVNLSATAAGSGSLIWLDTIAGPILNTGTSYSPFVTSTQTYYVIENPSAVTANVGLSATAPGLTAYASATINYQTFDVLSPGGIIINTVDIIPNIATPLGTAVAIQLEDATGNALGAPVATVTTAQGTVQTLTLNMFVPQGTAYRLRLASNPNIQYHQGGFVNPYTIPGQVAITGWGPPNATTLYFGLYNWSISTFYVVSAGCYSAPSIATATVNAPPAFVITLSGPTAYCNTGAVTLDAITNSDPSYVSFLWTPATGLSNATIGNPVASPTVTTTYTLTANDGLPNGCETTASVTVTVNTGPTVSIDPAPFDSLCSGASFNINATAGSSSFKTVGTGTNSINNTIAIYDGFNPNVKTQVLYTAAELNAAGLIGPGNITSASFNVVNKLSTTPLVGFTMRMGSVASAPPLTTTYLTPVFTTVFAGNVSTVLGWNQHVFTTPFFWDGTSNVVLEVCNGTPGIPGFDQLQCTPTVDARTITANLLGCAALTGATSLNRPNTRFTGGNVLYSWAPAGELSASNIEDPIYTATSDGVKSLVLTVTDPSNGCQATSTLNFTISGTPKAPAIATSSSTDICVSATVTVVASGTTGSYQWQSSTDNSTWGDISGETNDTLVILVNTDTYFRAKASCTNDAFSNSIFFDVTSPALPVGTGDVLCGQGIASLSATVDPGLFDVWYTDATGGSYIQIGSPLDTFLVATDTFWVAASVAPVPAPGPAPTNYPANTAGSTIDEDITAVTIASLVNNQPAPNCALYTDYTALPAPVITPGSSYPFSITIGDCENATPFASGVAMYIDYNRDGDFDDIDEQAYTTVVTTSALSWTVSGNFTVPVTASIGFTRVRIINAEGIASPTSNQAYTYGETEDYLVQIGSTVCQSPRIPVVATVTPAPPIDITPSSATICEGDSVLLQDGFGSYPFGYSWSPALTLIGGPIGDLLGGAYAAPTVTTSYILTGNDGFCQNSDTIVVTVNPKPVFTVSTPTPNVCNGDTVTINANITSPVGGVYTATPIAFSPTAITGTAGPVGDDVVASAIPIGFNFDFYGNTYSNLSISTNGFISFDAAPGSGCCSGQTLPNAAAPNNLVALGWEDLTAASGQITYATVGTSPNQVFIVDFNNVAHLSGTGTPLTGQIKLYEGTNIVEVHTAAYSDDGTVTTQGIENSTGTLATAVPGRNGVTGWVANNDAFRFSLPAAATISWTGQNIITPSNTASIQAVPGSSGYYAVTVTNPLTGCVKSDSVFINFAAQPKPIIADNDTTLCNPDTINVNVIDTGLYVGGYPAGTNFTWSAIGVPIPDLNEIGSNNGSSYSVIVTLPNGCSASSDTAIILTKSVAVVDVITPASCTSLGSIAVEVTSGLPNYNYIWSTDLAQTNIISNVTKTNNQDTLSNLTAGTYYLQVYDEAGTPASCNSGVLTYVVGGISPIVVDSVVGTNISCTGFADGTATVYYTGGSGPYSIVWSDAQFADVASRNIAAGGTYTVTVSDGSGCFDIGTVTVIEPLPLGITLSSTPASIGGPGSATAVGFDGTGPYTYEWLDSLGIISVGVGSPINLPAALYYGVVTDANNCQFADTIRIDSITDASFNLTMLIEGFYNGAGGLTPALQNSGVGLSGTECDTIYVELRDQLTPANVLASGTAVLNTSGQASFTFPGSVIGENGYIAVFHRNAVQTWSDLMTFSSVTNYNFTTAATQAYGSNMILVAPDCMRSTQEM